MKILFTGSSSFTGFWFINYLLKDGHSITATFTKNNVDDYKGIRKTRILNLINKVVPIFNSSFGNENFLELLRQKSFDLICNHGAEVSDYRSASFNFSSALKNNTYGIRQVLNLIREYNSKLLITGSVFEGQEGLGSGNSIAFSPYGLSKQITSETFKYFCNSLKVPLAKFVIPNPFGPFEEERFTSFLVKSWIKGEKPVVKTPIYIRDNIHISLLASCYAKFCSNFYNSEMMFQKINPSGYVESQGQFTKRFSEEISKRLNIDTSFELSKQTDFGEPILRINIDPALQYIDNWNEETAWDELVEYYKSAYAV